MIVIPIRKVVLAAIIGVGITTAVWGIVVHYADPNYSDAPAIVQALGYALVPGFVVDVMFSHNAHEGFLEWYDHAIIISVSSLLWSAVCIGVTGAIELRRLARQAKLDTGAA